MDKSLRYTLIIGIAIISLSFAYALVYKPIRTENDRRFCVNWVNQQLHNQYTPPIFDMWFGVCAKARGITN
jgi:hypothetical protein